jgi:hypothetical protein
MLATWDAGNLGCWQLGMLERFVVYASQSGDGQRWPWEDLAVEIVNLRALSLASAMGTRNNQGILKDELTEELDVG